MDANLSEKGCDYHYGLLEKTSNTKQDWDKMIYSLTNCKSLNNLSISNFCSNCFDCKDIFIFLTFNDSRLHHIEFSMYLEHFDTIFGKIKSLSNDQSKTPNSYPIVKEIHMCILRTDNKEKVLLKKRIQDEYYLSNLNDHRTIINIL
ncbi:hypothetical protein ACTFIR_012532 [Dictyostelium discoideum]